MINVPKRRLFDEMISSMVDRFRRDPRRTAFIGPVVMGKRIPQFCVATSGEGAGGCFIHRVKSDHQSDVEMLRSAVIRALVSAASEAGLVLDFDDELSFAEACAAVWTERFAPIAARLKMERARA